MRDWSGRDARVCWTRVKDDGAIAIPDSPSISIAIGVIDPF